MQLYGHSPTSFAIKQLKAMAASAKTVSEQVDAVEAAEGFVRAAVLNLSQKTTAENAELESVFEDKPTRAERNAFETHNVLKMATKALGHPLFRKVKNQVAVPNDRTTMLCLMSVSKTNYEVDFAHITRSN